MCGHAWDVTPEFPRGDPLMGGPWAGSYPDPGNFDGDELWGPAERDELRGVNGTAADAATAAAAGEAAAVATAGSAGPGGAGDDGG